MMRVVAKAFGIREGHYISRRTLRTHGKSGDKILSRRGPSLVVSGTNEGGPKRAPPLWSAYAVLTCFPFVHGHGG